MVSRLEADGQGNRSRDNQHNRVRRFSEDNIAEKIFNEILRQYVEKKLVGREILYTDSTYIKAKTNRHKKNLVTVPVKPKEYMDELKAQINLDRKVLGKKPFDNDDDPDDLDDPNGGKTTALMMSRTDPDSGQQTREGKRKRKEKISGLNQPADFLIWFSALYGVMIRPYLRERYRKSERTPFRGAARKEWMNDVCYG